MTRLWIAGGVSIGLVALLTFLGGQALDMPVGPFYLFIGVLAVLMVLVGKGQGWPRWVVSAVLAFFGVAALRGGGIEGVVIAGAFGLCAVVFFRYRPGAPAHVRRVPRDAAGVIA